MSSRLADVLARATIADVLRLSKTEPPTNDRQAILCPLPDHAERTPSFRVQQSGRGYRCHGCGAHGGIIELAVAMGLAQNKAEAVDVLAERFNIPKDESDESWKAKRTRMQRDQASVAFALPAEEVEAKTTAEDRERLRAALRGLVPLDGTPSAGYLESRGICAVAAASHATRFHSSWLGRGPAVVFAVRDREGRIVAAQGRFLDAGASPKAMTKGQLSRGVYAIGAALDPRLDVVAITEAPIDALSLAVCELPSIALCGASARPAWLRKALAFRSVVLATDADAAGDAAAEGLRSWLNLGTRCTRLALPEGVKDANELLRQNPAKLLELARWTRFAALPEHLALDHTESAS